MINRIKQLRKRDGMDQLELAEFLNISQSTLSNWERGVHDIDNNALVILSQKFNVTTDYILGKSDIPYNTYNEQNIQNNSSSVLNDTLTENSLSVDENELVRIYRILNAKQRHKLMSFAFDMEENDLKEKIQSTTYIAQNAARNGGEPTTEEMTQEELDTLMNAKPQTY